MTLYILSLILLHEEEEGKKPYPLVIYSIHVRKIRMIIVRSNHHN